MTLTVESVAQCCGEGDSSRRCVGGGRYERTTPGRRAEADTRIPGKPLKAPLRDTHGRQSENCPDGGNEPALNWKRTVSLRPTDKSAPRRQFGAGVSIERFRSPGPTPSDSVVAHSEWMVECILRRIRSCWPRAAACIWGAPVFIPSEQRKFMSHELRFEPGDRMCWTSFIGLARSAPE